MTSLWFSVFNRDTSIEKYFSKENSSADTVINGRCGHTDLTMTKAEAVVLGVRDPAGPAGQLGAFWA